MMTITTFSKKRKSFADELAMDEMVTVYVGKDNKAYRVQQALLCSASSWFRKAQFVKSDKDDTLELRLPDAEFDVFEDFLCWLFHRKMQDRLTKLTCMVAKAKRQAHTSRLVRTWVFGDKYSIPRLQNATVRELVRAFDDDRPSAAVISQVYETTAKGSKLRKLFAKQAAVGLWVGSRNGIESGWAHSLEALSALQCEAGFTADLLAAIVSYNRRDCDCDCGCGCDDDDDDDEEGVKAFLVEEDLPSA